MIIFGVKISRWHFKAFKAFCAFVALGLILIMVYSQNQSYKYIVSHKALKKAYLQEDVGEMVTNAEGMWEWFEAMIDRANIRDLYNVEANCAYEIPLPVDVTIENISYILHDPTPQDHSCQNPQYPISSNDDSGVFISGNHEILTFGLFQSRSAKKLSREKSQGPNLPGRSILTPDIVSLDAMTDERVVEVCQLLTSSSAASSTSASSASTVTPSLCVSRDGYAGDFGSSFSWKGKYFQDISRPAYDHDYDKRYMKIPQKPFIPIAPCYTYNATTDVLINNPPIESLSQCVYFWTTPGIVMRSDCLLDFDNQPSSLFAFIAFSLGVPSVHQASDLIMGCSTLIDTPSHLLHQYSVSTSLAIQNTLESEDMHGTFFLTQSNLQWMTFAKFYAKQLIMHGFIDSNTRKISVFTVLRNLGDENLFYALVNVTFTLQVSGEMDHYFDVQYVPIVQYFYGLDDYPYVRNEVIVSEAFFLTSLVLVILISIALKIYKRIYPSQFKQNPDSDTGSGTGTGIGTDHHNDSKRIDNVMGSNGSTAEALDPFGLPPPPPPPPHHRRSSIINKVDLAYIQDDNYSSCDSDSESDTTGDSDGDDGEGINKTRLSHQQQRRNFNLSKKIVKTNMADISLRDFSAILLPDVDAADNMSSASEEDSNEDSDEESNDENDNKENENSLAVLKKQVSFVTKQSTKSIKTVTKIINKNKTKKYKKYFSLCVLFIIIATIICRVLYILEARDLHDFLTSAEVIKPAEPGSLFTGYDTHFEDIIEKFESLQKYEIAGRVLSVVCIFFSLTQFFSYLTFDKRFGLVTATLVKAVHDIVPMLIILLSVLFTYSVLGCVIYGQNIEDFASVGESMSTLLIIMLGEVNAYDEMKEKNKILTMLYFWSFVILAVFIIFNMVLALIFTLYDEEYRDLKSLNERQRLEAIAEADKKRRERIAAIKRRKFVRRNNIRMKMNNKK